jgi:hypothetical protein
MADQIDMGLWNWGREEPMPKGTLTPDERIALERLEATVEAGVEASNTVLAAGKALAEIRERQLFRDTAATWDEYVTTRFKITRRRGDQMVAYAGVKTVLEDVSTKTGTPVPVLSELASRPLVGLSADTISEIVTEAAGSPEGVTAGSIRKAASKRKAKAAKAPRPRRFKVPGAVIVVTFNRKSTGSVIEALEAAIRQAAEDQADAA